jgi:UDP-3-O-[3-hydroxymyristoyl] glucosamine N-acyltransferase
VLTVIRQAQEAASFDVDGVAADSNTSSGSLTTVDLETNNGGMGKPMLTEHEGSIRKIADSAYKAPNATICGGVSIGPGCRIMFGACVVAEHAPIVIGENCIVMENAVIRNVQPRIPHLLQTSIFAKCSACANGS